MKAREFAELIANRPQWNCGASEHDTCEAEVNGMGGLELKKDVELECMPSFLAWARETFED